MSDSGVTSLPRIQALSIQLANQIAAGEVVERPSSVLKELLENALDAKADDIHIEVEKAGTRLIRITDNGCGIHHDDLPLALSRHATSKIKSLSDLEAVLTLGFRGEALASISSVSRLALTSHCAQQEHAWQAYAEGRDMAVQITPASHPIGTRVEVRDLFYNTPARRKFLRSEKTEFAHLEDTFKRMALSHMSVAFRLTHNNKSIYQLPQACTPAEQIKRLSQLCGSTFAQGAQYIDCHVDDMRLFGWLARPDVAKSHLPLQSFFINGRMTRDKVINHSIRMGYQSLLAEGLSPCYVLFLQMDAEQLDVNVHPTKHEVRFKQSRWVHDFISSHIQHALKSMTTDAILETPEPITAEPILTSNYRADSPAVRFSKNPSAKAVEETNSFYQQLFAKPLAPSNASEIPTVSQHTQDSAQPILQVFHQRYAVMPSKRGLDVLDAQWMQHQLNVACYWQMIRNKTPEVRPLLLPVNIHLNQACESASTWQARLQEYAWKTQLNGADKLQLTEVPRVLFHYDYVTFLQLWLQSEHPITLTSAFTWLSKAKPSRATSYDVTSFNHLYQQWLQHQALISSLPDAVQHLELDLNLE